MSYREFGLKGKLTPNSQKELHWLSLQVRQWYFAFYFLLSSSVCFLRNLCLCSACLSGQSVQLLSCVGLCATSWTAAHQASLSITNSQSLLRLMSIESVMPSNHLFLCCPLLLLPPAF